MSYLPPPMTLSRYIIAYIYLFIYSSVHIYRLGGEYYQKVQTNFQGHKDYANWL